jgi:hypothetical protein
MPIFHVYCTAQTNRTYEIEAADADEAQELVGEGAGDIVQEEEVSEEIDGVALQAKPPLAPKEAV